MAWTTPRTWVTSEVVTASVMNTHVRDNFNETAPAIGTTAGRVLVVSGTNTIAQRLVDGHAVDTSQTTTSTSYTDLATSGPAVTGTTGTKALVFVGAQTSNSSAGAQNYMSFEVTGATAISAADGSAYMYESSNADDVCIAGSPPFEVTLTAGTNTFTAKYRTTTGTATFHRRKILVFCL